MKSSNANLIGGLTGTFLGMATAGVLGFFGSVEIAQYLTTALGLPSAEAALSALLIALVSGLAVQHYTKKAIVTKLSR